MLDERIPVASADGHNFALQVVDTPGARVAVVVLPAMGVTSTYYQPLIGELARAGFSAITADWRGHGESDLRARRSVDWGYRELIELDLAATVQATRHRFPGLELMAFGHSLGGQIACLHAAGFPGSFSKVALMAAVNVHFRGWGAWRGIATLAATQSVAALAVAVGYFPGHRLRFAGREGRTQMVDWARNARTGRWDIAGSELDYESLLGELMIPVLGMSLEGDVYAPARAMDNLLAKMPQAAVTRHHWTAADLDAHGLDHFRWAQHSAPIAAMLRRWIG